MMQSYIWLKTADGSIQRVEQEIAMFFPMICQEVVYKGVGTSKNHAISLPQQVNQAVFSLILDYCRFHKVPGRSNKVCMAVPSISMSHTPSVASLSIHVFICSLGTKKL